MNARPVFHLELHQTYYDQGFFNVIREFDRYVRPDDGSVVLVLGQNGREIGARVDRRAQSNGTARILGRAALRDWFQEEYEVGDIVPVRFDAPDRMTMG